VTSSWFFIPQLLHEVVFLYITQKYNLC